MLGHMHEGPRSRVLTRLAVVLVVPVLFTAACGAEQAKDAGIATADTGSATGATSAPPSSAPTSAPVSGKSAFFDAQMAYTQCMRKEGMRDWPDPKLSGYPNVEKIEEVQKAEDAKDQQNALGRAMHACVEPMRAAMTLEPEKDQQKMYESLLAHAQCMRANGVSQFTNPTMQGGNAIPGGDPSPASPRIDPDSPVYKQARAACKDKLIEPAEGMQ